MLKKCDYLMLLTSTKLQICRVIIDKILKVFNAASLIPGDIWEAEGPFSLSCMADRFWDTVQHEC